MYFVNKYYSYFFTTKQENNSVNCGACGFSFENVYRERGKIYRSSLAVEINRIVLIFIVTYIIEESRV